MPDELNIYNISDSTWEKALSITREYIVNRIRSKAPYKFVSYSELSEVINSSNIGLQLDGEGRNPILWALAGALSRDEDKAGRGMMSALIVHKTGDKEPGYGFYDWAKQIGKRFSDEQEFWWKEVRKVCKAYGVNNV